MVLKITKTETQRNHVPEMYLYMVQDIKNTMTVVISSMLLPPFWINVDLLTIHDFFMGYRRFTVFHSFFIETSASEKKRKN